MDWQPIETAPKDGTEVDLWAVRWEFADRKAGKIQQQTRRWIGASFNTYDPGWTASDAVGATVYIIEHDDWVVTHWMLPPAPPSP